MAELRNKKVGKLPHGARLYLAAWEQHGHFPRHRFSTNFQLL
jgi:hypothetical protein